MGSDPRHNQPRAVDSATLVRCGGVPSMLHASMRTVDGKVGVGGLGRYGSAFHDALGHARCIIACCLHVVLWVCEQRRPLLQWVLGTWVHMLY